MDTGKFEDPVWNATRERLEKEAEEALEKLYIHSMQPGGVTLKKGTLTMSVKFQPGGSRAN